MNGLNHTKTHTHTRTNCFKTVVYTLYSSYKASFDYKPLVSKISLILKMNQDTHCMILKSILAVLYSCYLTRLQYIFLKGHWWGAPSGINFNQTADCLLFPRNLWPRVLHSEDWKDPVILQQQSRYCLEVTEAGPRPPLILPCYATRKWFWD